MSSGRGDDKDGPADRSWTDEVGGIEPLEGRADRVADRSARPREVRSQKPAEFSYPDPGEPGLGIASGINTAQLRRLRAGRIAAERTLDLHQLAADDARRSCLDEISAAIEAGERCVLVVHGKGLHSKGAAVLRPALSEWVADPRLQGQVLAFCPAHPKDGGSGASYVLLRRTLKTER